MNPAFEDAPWRARREQMVAVQIEGRGIRNPAVLAAMRQVPRHRFVPAALAEQAYGDSALGIGFNQTISQPYIVGLMTELIAPAPGQKILEIGTGSGYQAALLGQIGCQVFTVEIVAELVQSANQIFRELKLEEKIQAKLGDGFLGWPEEAPFDSMLITCALSQVPLPLVAQLKPHGRMVLPLGDSLDFQTLTLITKTGKDKLAYQNITGVVFVPMTGPHGFRR